MSKKISELTTEKKVRRIKKDSYGNRYQEVVDFDIKYNPTIRNFSIRLFAKIIDLIIYVILGIIIYKLIGRKFNDMYELFAVSFALLIILNPILETFFGKSFGKFLLKIQIVNDYGNKPNLLLSFKRNALSFVNVFQLFRPIPGELGIKNNKHNEICETYTISDKQKCELLTMLSN
ncbi:RDD family protein [Kaistella polysaccharea]|uniref:RDD family protein n=1 Tax=Kaistella polysaccharea TaxID=2878534 RepID=UPI001CF2F06F|nr:RDD family protein [Kaistella polysaccharea]